MKKNVLILGSTGSIGTQTLEVISRHSSYFTPFALVAQQNVASLFDQIVRHTPRFAVMTCPKSAQSLSEKVHRYGLATSILSGHAALLSLVAHDAVDDVVAAMSGAIGLESALLALKKGKRLLLANKEALVMGGQFFMETLRNSPGQLLPLDSEHTAIFQLLPPPLQGQLGKLALQEAGIKKIYLTGSGGPLRNLPLADLDRVTPEQACAHPNWSMGKKISVDSATMMNKGLEYIEAHWLFNAAPETIDIVLHPQSLVHGLIAFRDGSIFAQLNKPSMLFSIAYALNYPNRRDEPLPASDFFETPQRFDFEALDFNRYPCLQLALDACRAGQVQTTLLNAANEMAVQAFLMRRIRFTDITAINQRALETLSFSAPLDIEALIAIDSETRQTVAQWLPGKA